MKILDWVHRKFRHNSNETSKDFSIGYTGQAYSDDLPAYPKGVYGNKPLTRSQRDIYRRNSFASLEAARVEEEEEEVEEERVTALTELFHGFLAVGTLGTTDPGTPTFSISVDHIAEKETQVTEDELKLINDELEKVLAAEGDNCNASSGRNSHGSVGRMSHCSAITLSGKPIESAEAYNSEGAICPLQSYLFGSAVGLQETATLPPKKEQRTSLGELFQKTKQVEENCGAKSDKRSEKESDKSAVHVMKKMLKRRIVNASKIYKGVDSATAETKLTKILQIFNRKVHPESPTSCFQSHNPTKNEIKNSNAQGLASDSGSLRPSAEDIIIYPQQAISKESTCNYKNQPHPPHLGDATGSELWVKTDADYLVLEL